VSVLGLEPLHLRATLTFRGCACRGHNQEGLGPLRARRRTSSRDSPPAWPSVAARESRPSGTRSAMTRLAAADHYLGEHPAAVIAGLGCQRSFWIKMAALRVEVSVTQPPGAVMAADPARYSGRCEPVLPTYRDCQLRRVPSWPRCRVPAPTGSPPAALVTWLAVRRTQSAGPERACDRW